MEMPGNNIDGFLDRDTSNLSFNDEEIKRITDLFAIFIKVDQRISHENKNKRNTNNTD